MRGWVFILAALFFIGCSAASQRQVSHVATVHVGQALSWLEARLEASGTEESQEHLERLRRAQEAQELISEYLDGEPQKKDTLQTKILLIQEALELAIEELRSRDVELPHHVETAVGFLPILAESIK